MARYAVAGIIVIGLAVGIWLLLPRDETSPTTTSPPSAAASTTTSTSTAEPTTTTTASEPDGHVVETVEEAEEILRELWFGWFEGIYNQDEDRIREVVASEEQVATAREQFGVMEFTSSPTEEALTFTGTEILRSDARCAAIWSGPQSSFRPGSSSGVHVIRRVDERWVMVSYWLNRGDLWEQDCEVELS